MPARRAGAEPAGGSARKGRSAKRAASPALSVVMPVYNALPYLDEAIASVLGQTFEDFELVLLDDGSTDGSRERLREWAKRDARIRLIESARNLGPALSSQKVAEAARAPIVARADADDICLPTRLEEQMAVLGRHPEVGLVGGLAETIDSAGRVIRRAEPWRLAKKTVIPPFGNGLMMYRRALFDQVGGYRPECRFWEDLDLVLRMARATRVAVIPHAIYQVRQSSLSTRSTSARDDLEQAIDLMYRSVARVAEGRSYDDLLKAQPARPEKIDPRVFVALGSVILWSGGRPGRFRRFLKRSALPIGGRSLTTTAWAAWASLSPASLRAFLNLMVAARNRLSAAILPPGQLVEWKPGVGAIAPLGTDG